MAPPDIKLLVENTVSIRSGPFTAVVLVANPFQQSAEIFLVFRAVVLNPVKDYRRCISHALIPVTQLTRARETEINHAMHARFKDDSINVEIVQAATILQESLQFVEPTQNPGASLCVHFVLFHQLNHRHKVFNQRVPNGQQIYLTECLVFASQERADQLWE